MGRYQIPIWETFASALQLDTHYSDSVFKEATNDRLIAADPYWLLNGRFSIFQTGGRWEAAFWGRNLTDTQYVVQGLDVATFFIGNRNYNAPRTVGFDLSYYFG